FHVTGVQTCALPILDYNENLIDQTNKKSGTEIEIENKTTMNSKDLFQQTMTKSENKDRLNQTEHYKIQSEIDNSGPINEIPLKEQREEIRKMEEKKLNEKLKDRKSTRLNSSHVKISYAVFCLKKKIETKDLEQQ